MSNVIPFPGRWKSSPPATKSSPSTLATGTCGMPGPNGARCQHPPHAGYVAHVGVSGATWRDAPPDVPLLPAAPRMDTPPETLPSPPSQPNAPGFNLGPDECLACGKFDACTCEDCPSCEGRGYPGELTGVGRGGQGACPDCKGAGRIPSA